MSGLVMPSEDWVQHWIAARFLYDWQTLIAGVLAVLAAWRTIRATINSANREVEASHAQTAVAQKQIETTIDLAQRRDASEASAFHAMLEAAMARVLAEADRAKETYPQYVGQAQGASIDPQGESRDALTVRECFTKGAFAELRAACVRRGGPLTREFLDLEREIDSFAMQREDQIITAGFLVQWGKHAGLREQFVLIEKSATALRAKAAEQILMVRISISEAAFEAIAKTLPLGSVGYENEVDEKGERYVWLPPNIVDRLRHLRGPGERYSDVILRLAKDDA